MLISIFIYSAIYFIIFSVISAFLVLSVTLFRGYIMYRGAIAEKSLSEVVEETRKRESYVKLQDINPVVTFAILFMEDKYFFHHRGFDYPSIKRAFLHNYRNRRIILGGSTISQQLVKNFFFVFDRLYTRKAAEIFAVRSLEKSYSKKEILELYMNYIYFGKDMYGVRDACRKYFAAEPSDVRLDQAILLASIIPSPERYNPINSPALAGKCFKLQTSALFTGGYLEKRDAVSLNNIGQLENNEREKYYILKYAEVLKELEREKAGCLVQDEEVYNKKVEEAAVIFVTQEQS